MIPSTRKLLAPDGGLTLVELLVTVAIVGVAFASLIAGISTYTTSGANHQLQAETQLQLREFAERVTVASYVDCATSYDSAYTPPSGFGRVSSVRLWNPATSAYDITPTAGCTDPRLQRVTLTLTRTRVPLAYTTTLDIVKRG